MKKWILQCRAPLSGSVTAHSSAAAQDIWAALTDITRMGEWSPECTGCTWITDGHIGVGAQFRGFNRWGPLRWSTMCTIDVFSVDRCFAYSARHSSGATTQWTYDLRSDETGTTVTESFESVDSPTAVLVLDRLARRPSRLHRQMTATLVRLLRHIEQRGARRVPDEPSMVNPPITSGLPLRPSARWRRRWHRGAPPTGPAGWR